MSEELETLVKSSARIKINCSRKLFTFRGGPLDKDDEQLSHEAPVKFFNYKVLSVSLV